MHYLYTLENGLTPIKTNTKKYIISAIACAGLVVALAVPALAAKPANPGCFGTDRANAIKTQFLTSGTWNLNTAPGASDWGEIAAFRAGDNGQINRNYVCQQ